ncbi:MAG: hypothetical protein JXR18_07615 [Neptuniibacter sp.]
MKSVFTKVSAISALLVTTPALAHSDQTSMLSGIVHFMTEPDHLLVSALLAAAVIYSIRNAKTKRS